MDIRTLEALSEKLSPIDIKNREFKKAVWGYAPQEVVDFLDATAKAWERVQKQEKDLLDKVKTLNDEVLMWRKREQEFEAEKVKMEQQAKAIKEKAEEDSRMLLDEVNLRAEEIRARTEEWLASVISEVEETERRRDSFVSAFRAALDQHYALLDNNPEATKPLEIYLENFLREDQKNSLGRATNRLKGKLPADPRQTLS
jgi:cell division initiation protein